MDIIYNTCLTLGLMNLLNFESLNSQQAREYVADLFQYWSVDTLIVCNGTINNI